MSNGFEFFTIEETQFDYLSEQIHLNAPPVYRVELPRADGRFYTMFDEGRPILLTSGTTAITDGYVDKEKDRALMKWRQGLITQGINPDEYTVLRQDYGTILHAIYGDLLSGLRIPMGTHSECNFEEYLRGIISTKNLKISEKSIDYVVNTAVDELRKDIMSFIQWVKDYKVIPLAIEHMGAYPKYKVGSAIDLICSIEISDKQEVETGEVFKRGPRKGEAKTETKVIKRRVIIVVDFKSGKKGFFGAHALQLELYRRIVVEIFGIYELYGVYNFAPADWRTEPSYHFKCQSNNPVLVYFDAVMQQGMLKFEKKNKTYTTFSGFADTAGTSDCRMITVDILRELYTIYCPEFLDELGKEREVSMDTQEDVDFAQAEVTIEEPSVELEPVGTPFIAKEETPTLVELESGERVPPLSDEKLIELVKEAENENPEIVETMEEVKKLEDIVEDISNTTIQGLLLTSNLDNLGTVIKGTNLKVGSVMVRRNPDIMIILRDVIDGHVQTDCVWAGRNIITSQYLRSGYGLLENYEVASEEEINMFKFQLSERGIDFIEDGVLVYNSENNIDITTKVEWYADSISTVFDTLEELSTTFKVGDIISKKTPFIHIIAEYAGTMEGSEALLSKRYWNNTIQTIIEIDEPCTGFGYISEFSHATEEEKEILKPKNMDDKRIEKMCDEYDSYMDSQSDTIKDEEKKVVPPSLVALVKLLASKDTPRAKSVHLGKQPWSILDSLHEFVKGIRLDPAVTKKEAQDILKEIDYSAF